MTGQRAAQRPGQPERANASSRPGAPEDHVIVLFGATGDIAKRKLLPGLFHLHAAELLPRDYRIIGSAPKSFAMTEEQFRRTPGMP
jgi:glucose-6-phosphate 1-dehydrogenase